MSAVSALSISGPTLPISSEEHTIKLDITEATENATITFEIEYDEILSDIFEGVVISDLELINNTTSGQVNLTYEIPDDFEFEFGETYSITINAEEEDTNTSINDSAILTFEEQDLFCTWDGGEAEETEDLRVKISDIFVEGFGENDEWFPFDEIEVEIEVQNRNDDYDIKDIVVEWGLYNWDTNEWTIEVDYEKDFNLKNRNEEILTINFKLENLDEDFEDLVDGDFMFYVRATGEVDDEESYDTCASTSDEINIIIEDDFVIIDDFEFPEVTSCDSTIQITADVWNIGEDNQENIYVIVFNKDLGIDEKIEIGDIDSFKDERLDFEIQIPKNVEEQEYNLYFMVYDEYNDIYENSNDDKAEFYIPLKLEGNCVSEPQVIVTANLESEAKAGKDLIVKATITNTGDSLVTYTLDIKDYASWTTLVNIEPNTIILSAGSSEDVLITFNVNKDISGDQLFNIEVLSEDEAVITQPVSVTVEEQSGFNFPGITGNLISEGNWYLWGIGALNIILIIIIIIVALRVAKKE